MRSATIKRKTKETDIEVSVNLDGTGVASVVTGICFLISMVVAPLVTLVPYEAATPARFDTRALASRSGATR